VTTQSHFWETGEKWEEEIGKGRGGGAAAKFGNRDAFSKWTEAAKGGPKKSGWDLRVFTDGSTRGKSGGLDRV